MVAAKEKVGFGGSKAASDLTSRLVLGIGQKPREKEKAVRQITGSTFWEVDGELT